MHYLYLSFLAIGFTFLPEISLAAENVPEETGMISIEVVENPGFFEVYGNYVYLAIIVLFLGIFFWRRYSQGKSKT